MAKVQIKELLNEYLTDFLEENGLELYNSEFRKEGKNRYQTPLSNWIVLMTFLLALFLAFAKRRDDVLIYNETGMKVRKTVSRFNLSDRDRKSVV